MRRCGGDEVDDSTERIGAVESRACAFENLDGVHGFEREGQSESVVGGLGVVDAEAVDENESLGKTAAAQDDVGLCAARAALLDECRCVVAKEVERRLNGEQVRLDRQDLDGARGFCERNRGCSTEDDEGFGGSFGEILLRLSGRRALSRNETGIEAK